MKIDNFNVEDRGDLRDIVKTRLGQDLDANTETEEGDLPQGF